MSEFSDIEWTDHTFNPVRGCAKISPGCENCYAARDAVRFPHIRGVWGNSGTRVVAVPDAWKNPIRWNLRAQREGRRMKVFCASLADIFEDWKGELRFPADLAPDGWLPAFWDGRQLVREYAESAERQGLRKATMDDLRAELFQLIESTPHLDWQLLTKRPENVMDMVPEGWRQSFPENVWIGTTVEDQRCADQRVPELLKIPAKVRFLSCEPLLGLVNLRPFQPFSRAGEGFPRRFQGLLAPQIDWVICGGESGPKARPMHPDWARVLRSQCTEAGVPFFFKQWGEWRPQLDVGKDDPDGQADYAGMKRQGAVVLNADGGSGFHGRRVHMMGRVGKKAAGCLLDGVEHNAFPPAA